MAQCQSSIGQPKTTLSSNLFKKASTSSRSTLSSTANSKKLWHFNPLCLTELLSTRLRSLNVSRRGSTRGCRTLLWNMRLPLKSLRLARLAKMIEKSCLKPIKKLTIKRSNLRLPKSKPRRDSARLQLRCKI